MQSRGIVSPQLHSTIIWVMLSPFLTILTLALWVAAVSSVESSRFPLRLGTWMFFSGSGFVGLLFGSCSICFDLNSVLSTFLLVSFCDGSLCPFGVNSCWGGSRSDPALHGASVFLGTKSDILIDGIVTFSL